MLRKVGAVIAPRHQRLSWNSDKGNFTAVLSGLAATVNDPLPNKVYLLYFSMLFVK